MSNYNCIYKHGKPHRFEIIKYPDGQQNVKLDLNYFDNPKYPVRIKCSIRSWQELEVLMCLIAAFKSEDFIIHDIVIMYMFGLRSDRKFDLGSCNYVKDVIAPILQKINDECAHTISIYKPHGRIFDYIDTHSYKNPIYIRTPDLFQHMLKIGADKSAIEIVSNFSDFIRPEDIIHFDKIRSKKDIILNMKDHFLEKVKSSELPIVIMDDLCDGGATFIACAEYLRDSGIVASDRKLYLFVHHGLFSKGFDVLFKHFDRIYTTNSYQEFPQNPDDPLHIPESKLHVIDVWSPNE